MSTPYYSDEFVTLYHGDCLEVLPAIESECECGHPREEHGAGVDSKCLAYIAALAVPVRMCECRGYRSGPLAQIVVTSPPYNMGLVPGGNGRGMYRPSASGKGGRFREGYDCDDDAMPQDEYDALRREELALMWSLIPDDGAIYWNHRQRIEHGRARLPLGMDFPIPLRQIITWDRGTGIAPSLRHYCPVAEWVFLFAKPEFRLRSHSASGYGDVWRLGMAGPDSEDHPAPFPLSLPMRAIESSGAQSVFDPFAGSGTTLVAAKGAGIRSIGVEKSERYCEIAARRLAQDVLDFTGEAS